MYKTTLQFIFIAIALLFSVLLYLKTSLACLHCGVSSKHTQKMLIRLINSKNLLTRTDTRR